MKIGVPKEIKPQEYRVGLTPASVKELIKQGHTVFVEKGAGDNIGFFAQDYLDQGAVLLEDAAHVFAESDLIVKVKEPQPEECHLLREDQILFTYLHLAPDRVQTDGLLASGAIAIAYETVTDAHGKLPLLAPMSEVAGRLSVQAGAHALEKHQQGRGVLLGGVPGVAPANVIILGGGVVGRNAATIALGMGASVTVLDTYLPSLRQIDQQFQGRVKTVYSTDHAVEEHLRSADLVIGAVLVAGARAPKLVSKEMLSVMPQGAVLVDVAIDQGGCFETSKATTHHEPTYVIDGIVHYCVANMPASVARTSTQALNNATLPYVLSLANDGISALKKNPYFLSGLNIFKGKLCNKAVAESQERDFLPLSDIVLYLG